MPNWCQNVVTLGHADAAMIQRVVKGYTGKGIMQGFHPCPQELIDTMAGSYGAGTPEQAQLEARERANIEAYGAKNWYDWCVANWGTKWDITSDGNGEPAVGDDGLSVQFSFDSAWSPPVGFYGKMEELGFTVDAFYYEGGMGFCGRYSEGDDDYHEIKGNSDWVDANIPQEINDMFAISENMSTWEEEEAGEEQEGAETQPEQEVAIHHNDGFSGLAFNGPVSNAIAVIQALRPMIDQQEPGETPNWLSDFVSTLESLCQEAGALDENFVEV